MDEACYGYKFRGRLRGIDFRGIGCIGLVDSSRQRILASHQFGRKSASLSLGVCRNNAARGVAQAVEAQVVAVRQVESVDVEFVPGLGE